MSPLGLDAAQKLQDATTGSRLRLRQIGYSKSLSKSQKAEAAAVFGTTANELSSSKKLLDKKYPEVAKVREVLAHARSVWLSSTCPYIIPGVRLIRHDRVADLNEILDVLANTDLPSALAALQVAWDSLLEQRRSDLAELFDINNYPRASQLPELFAIEWGFPNIKPDELLLKLDPKLYEAECAKIKASFLEAQAMFEHEIAEQAKAVLDNILDKLSGGGIPGQKKILQKGAWEKISTVCDMFDKLNVASSSELTEAIGNLREVFNYTDVETVKKNQQVKETVSEAFDLLSKTFESFMKPAADDISL